jgi:hypothetical protein
MLAVIVLLASLTTSAQDDEFGPLPVISNDHADMRVFTSVIENPDLIEEELPALINVNGRNIEVPPGWSYTGFPGVGELPPFVRRWEEPGYLFAWDWINGLAGFAQDGIQLYGTQRYAIRVEYDTDLVYTNEDMPFVPSDFQVIARLHTAQGGLQELPPISMEGLNTSHEIEWVIESPDNPAPFVRLEVMFKVDWPLFTGFANLRQIDLVTVPDDYRPAFVIEFE